MRRAFGRVFFSYGTDNERFKSQYTKNDTVQYTRYYFDTYEKEILADGTERNLDYIYAGDNLVAIHVTRGNTDTTFFVYTDYLGSLRCITDSTGKVRQRLGFDAWGNRRNPITGLKDTTIVANLLFARGFTGHSLSDRWRKHIDELGLINMNGRVYDPALGMFISPDNYVQQTDNTQNFNRYTYCLNNPLMFTDPSGDFIFTVLAAVFCPPLLPLAICADIGGALNLYSQYSKGNVTSIGTGVSAWGIGVFGGVAAFYTGGAALAPGAGFFAAGTAGMVGYSTNFAVTSIGNVGVLGDAPPTTQEFVSGLATSFLFAGTLQGINSATQGNNFWSGDPIARGIFSFNNTARPITDAQLAPIKPIEIGSLPNNPSIKTEINTAIPDEGSVVYKESYIKPLNVGDGQHCWNKQTIQIVVDNGKIFPGMGNDGKSILIQQLGDHNGIKGLFEIIVKEGVVTHQRFIPGGIITGIPNKVTGVSGGCNPPFPWWK